MAVCVPVGGRCVTQHADFVDLWVGSLCAVGRCETERFWGGSLCVGGGCVTSCWQSDLCGLFLAFGLADYVGGGCVTEHADFVSLRAGSLCWRWVCSWWVCKSACGLHQPLGWQSVCWWWVCD